MAYNVSRMTMFALISSLEEDLRSIIKLNMNSVVKSEYEIEDQLFEKSKERFIKENGTKEKLFLSDFVDYFDFGDTYKFINSNKKFFPTQISELVKNNTPQIQNIASIRNRVMHIRPLNMEDFPVLNQ